MSEPIERLTVEIDELKARLAETQRTLDATDNVREILARGLERQGLELEAAQGTIRQLEARVRESGAVLQSVLEMLRGRDDDFSVRLRALVDREIDRSGS
jgi:hypothetical protein